MYIDYIIFLLNIIDNILLRDIFEDGYMDIYHRFENSIKGDTLVHATCGCGKSRLLYKTALTHFLTYDNSLVMAVFPSIALITQFNTDYISNDLGKNLFKVLSVCSRNELDQTKCKEVTFTTDSDEISSFVNTEGQKLVCCTYQSLQNFADSLGERERVDFCLFDEAHHTESPSIEKLINSDNRFYENAMFLTATPSKRMRERLDRICYVPYSLALEKGYVKQFEVRIDVGRKTKIPKNKNTLIYESIARTILETGNNKVMTFHNYTNNKITPQDEAKATTAVKNFVKEKLFKESFEKILKTEFPHLSNKYKKITFKACTADTRNRETLLRKFDETKDDEIFIISSCKTIGEGVDTKKANMTVFVDSKQSWKEIMQNIGRCIRINGNEVATVLLPVFTDYEPYEDCKTLEEKDEVLRTQINHSGNFDKVLNVCSALKQHGEVDFENCLLYPKKYKDDKGSNGLNGKARNDEGDDEGDEKVDDNKRKKKRNRKRIKINIHTDPEFQVLWGIKDNQVFDNIIKSTVIDCIVKNIRGRLDIWKDNLNKVKQYIDTYKKRPSCEDKDKDIKSLGTWLSNQQRNYKNKEKIMENQDIYDEWTAFINDDNYKKYFYSNEDIWKDNFNKVKQYIDTYKKKPSTIDKDKDIKSLGNWITTQQRNYKNKEKIMENQDIYDEWTAFINDDNYKKYFYSNEDIWKDNFNKVKQYIDTYKKKPSTIDKDKDIKSLGKWLSNQQRNYNNKEKIMKNEDIYDEWTAFINDDNYKKYFYSNENAWKDERKVIEDDISCDEGDCDEGDCDEGDCDEGDCDEGDCDEDCDCVNCEDERKEKMENCVHKWKVLRDDEKYNYKECELCERKSKESRMGKEEGYKEPNPDKKKEINNWLSKHEYNDGKAILLDAKGLKTSNLLLDSGKFSSENIVIPEYDINMYEINKCDKRLGKCLINGDYLEEIKKCDIKKISLIYADFTGSYKKFVLPLLEYMKEKKEDIIVGTVIGLTWSNNGVGDKSKRGEILRSLGRYEKDIGMKEIDLSPTENGYGNGGCMNVIFYRKI